MVLGREKFKKEKQVHFISDITIFMESFEKREKNKGGEGMIKGEKNKNK